MAQKLTIILRKSNGIIHIFGPTTIRTIVSLKSMKIFDKLIGARGASCVDEILHAGRALLVCHTTTS